MYVLSRENYESGIRQYVAYDSKIDSLNATLPAGSQLHIVCMPSYEAAKEDLSAVVQCDSTSSVFYWIRATSRQTEHALEDFTEAIRLGGNPYLYYNRGNVYVRQHDYARAVDDYSRAIELDNGLAEAWYNRGLARIALKQQAEGISDLSKAGELGLYTAYSIIKRYRQ